MIGAGISGLSAAWQLAQQVPGTQITVLDAADRPGGKLRGATLVPGGAGSGAGLRSDASAEPGAGLRVDVGAESVLARRPEALDLITEVGLAEQLVHPTGATAAIWSRDRLHPLPRRTLMGVPADPSDLSGLLTDQEVARARAEEPTPVTGEDVAIGELVAARLGDAVVDRLVEPLLGGVYAGHARSISAAAAAPALLAAARAGESLTATVDRLMPAPANGDTDTSRGATSTSRPPVFAGIEGGLHRLPAALVTTLTQRGVTIHSNTIVRELRRTGAAWQAISGPVPAPQTHDADRVVLALPSAPAARLLREVASTATTALATVETASMAVLTFAFPAAELPDLTGSGFLVPPRDGRFIKAATFSATKWAWVREHGRGRGPGGEDLFVLRASVGRHREESTLQHPDSVLLDSALADLSSALQTDLPAPTARHVQRWGGGLPQYAPGHLGLVDTVQDAVAAVGGLAVAGATYQGVGIPACIASGRAAAEQVLAG